MKKDNPVGSLLRQEKTKHPAQESSHEARIAELERDVEWLIREVKHLRDGTTP